MDPKSVMSKQKCADYNILKNDNLWSFSCMIYAFLFGDNMFVRQTQFAK